MKTVENLLESINHFNNLILPGDYEDYEGSLQTVRETMKKNKMSPDVAVELFEGLYEDFVLNNWDPEGNRILLCSAKYLHIQDLLIHSRYEEVFGEIHIVLKKYILGPYLKQNPSDEYGTQSRVLDTEEARIWDNYMISIFEYIKGVVEPELFHSLLNKEIMFRNLLLEELDYDTGYEPVLAKLKLLKRNQVVQSVQTKVTSTLSKAQYDEKLIIKFSTHNMLGIINNLLSGLPDVFSEKMYKDIVNRGPRNKEISYESLLSILAKELDEISNQYDFLGKKKKITQEEQAFLSILKVKLLSEHSYAFFVFLKSLQHSLSSEKISHAQTLFFTYEGMIQKGFNLLGVHNQVLCKLLYLLEDYFFSQKSPEFFKSKQ